MINILFMPSGFDQLNNVDQTIIQDIRYAGYHNFVGRPIDGYLSPKCILSTKAAIALKKAQSLAKKEGFSLKVWDCYRPVKAVNHFLSWLQDSEDTKMKQEFYPRLQKSELINAYIASKSGHSRGSTVDLTLVKLPADQQPKFNISQPLIPCYSPFRFRDNTIDMGTGFDCLDQTANTNNPSINVSQYQNRMLLKRIMQASGFKNYAMQWWHYTLLDQPFKNQFDFDVV